MLYEFMYGGVPFGEEEEDPYIIYEKVIEGKLVYPNFIDSKELPKSMIEQLLSKSPAMRTGGSGGSLKNHPWFIGFDWEALFNRQIDSPYKPKIPDLSREIQVALKLCKDINEIILKEEALDDPAISKTRKSLRIDENWDQEF